ncbi:MAG: hypothetical protein DCC71_12195 [Proteobacteria bacterium]|nr:MAG: hypothetical protein DCC71_12195 [Pseudomonadota bacterium]
MHFLLKVDDAQKGVDTYAEHKTVLDRLGTVWFGKFGTGLSRRISEISRRQLESGQTTVLFLSQRARVQYCGRVVEILSGRYHGKCLPRDTKYIPKYYRDQPCGVWFRLASLRPVRSSELMNISLFNDPTLRPSHRIMRPLIYVTTPL